MLGNDVVDHPFEHHRSKQAEQVSGSDAGEAAELQVQERPNLPREPAKFIRQPAQTTASAREMRQGTTCVVRVSNNAHSRPHNAAKCSRFGQCVDISGEKGELVLSPCSCCCSERRHELA